MKRILVICIIILLVVILAAVAIGYGVGRAIKGNVSRSGSSFNYSNPFSYSVGGADISEKITDLSINWLNGEVRVEEYDGNKLVLEERVVSGILRDDLKLRWKKEGKEVKIQYAVAGKRLDLDGFKKNLLVKVPSSWKLDDLEIDVVSADSFVSLREAKELSWDSVNGNIKAELDTLDSLSCNTVNGNVTLSVKSGTPRDIDIESVNSSVTISVPKDASFTLKRETINGSFNSEFAGKISDKTFTVGDGRSKWKMESVNGNVTILSL